MKIVLVDTSIISQELSFNLVSPNSSKVKTCYFLLTVYCWNHISYFHVYKKFVPIKLYLREILWMVVSIYKLKVDLKYFRESAV